MRKSIYIFLLVFLPLVSNAQWNCPSKLASYTKPIPYLPIKGGIELTGSGGIIDDNYFGFFAGYAALEYTNKQHGIFIEGGIKTWTRHDNGLDLTYKNGHPGFREAYYQFLNKSTSLRLGIQTITLDDHYLVNDRAAGLNFTYNYKKLSLQIAGGSVTKYFSRNGLFCNIGFVYDILHRDRGLMGNGLGQTNFTALTLSYKNKGIDKGLNKIGIALYDEFGSRIDTNVFMSGLYATLTLPFEIELNPEVLYQNAINNNAILYSIGLRKMFITDNAHRFDFQARVIGSTELDNGAMIRNSFSNLFLGDVIRLEAQDLPLYQASLRYSIPRHSLHFKLQYTSEFQTNGLSEIDFSVGKRVLNQVQLSAIGGYIKSPTLEHGDAFLARIEARVYLFAPQIRKNEK
ncbi:MAG: hypothetical protein M0O93_02435 [Bacteroidales bacterium]|nr:hypothetical protein [Bacteroidales bacterium]